MGAKVASKLGPMSSVKMNLVVSSWGLKGEELGAFLRKNGVYGQELEHWKELMMTGLDDEKPPSPESRRKYKNKIKSLEQELEEARAIIEAQKKVQKILEDEEKSTQKK